MAWRRTSTVFRGGSKEAQALFGRKVRARGSISLGEYFDERRPIGKPITIRVGEIGFVGHAKMDATIVLAFPVDQARTYANLEALARAGQFRSILCNWPTFREQFDIDM